MASTVFDSLLFRDMFGTQNMRAVFSDERLVRSYLTVEAALARAQVHVGLVPEQMAERISKAAQSMEIDWERLRKESEIVGYPILPLVRQLSAAAGDAGKYVHWGATTQDIMDTATVLQLRDALELVGTDLRELSEILSKLSTRYRDVPVAGRTHLQHALPVTFGYRTAVWLSSIKRHEERLKQLLPRLLVGQYSGAAGTLASLGEDGLTVQRLLCDELELSQPDITWHVARDAIAETIAFLGLVTGTLGKIATDVMMMASTEFGEVAEPFVPHRGASSTMPQKRNPISSELMLVAAKSVRQHVAAILDGMIQDFERATGPWHLEWISIPEAFLLTSSSLANAKFMLAGLCVNEDRMRTNLDLSGGLIVAEAVMMALAPALGRQTSHDRVYDACTKAFNDQRPLLEILLLDTIVVSTVGGREKLEKLCDPINYLGQAGEMVNRLLTNGREWPTTSLPNSTATNRV
ncbi:adenylosuccinate lyase family protein [Pararhizobium sp. YC-54]|uniref:class-II fumarase/aspartase family protein n=1 Tax=Pararhizobium sp. YC-54 TaxID=2986920 RepID=UPI0035588242